MKSGFFCYLLLISCLGCTGCLSGPYARQGAAIGALVGTPVGALIGSRNGETGAGALIGGTLGTLAGSNLGAAVDAEQQAFRNEPLHRNSGVSIQEIISMTQSGLGEDVIINHIQNQGLNRSLTTPDLIGLKQAGVSERVIQTMQTSIRYPVREATAIQQTGPVIVEEHYYPSWRPYWDAPCLPFHGHHGPRGYRRPVPPGSRASFSFTHRF